MISWALFSVCVGLAIYVGISVVKVTKRINKIEKELDNIHYAERSNFLVWRGSPN